MILFTTEPRLAQSEGALRQWYTDNLGAEDADVLVRWFWSKHGGTAEFIEVLALTAREADSRNGPGKPGGKSFLRSLVELARKPKEQREAIEEIMAWAAPRLKASAAIVQGHRGAEHVKAQEFDGLVHALEEKLWTMFPYVHRALMHGAIVTAFQQKDDGTQLDVATLVETLCMEDPLAVTAAASRG